jgi:hypothetical protein
MMLRLSAQATLLLIVMIVCTGAVPAAPIYFLQLPFVLNGSRSTIFGLEMSMIAPETGLDLVITSGTGWIRRNALLWNDVQPIENGAYNWDHPDIKQLEKELETASKHNLKVILEVRSSPAWAVRPYTAGCAPVNPTHYDEFAQFLAAAVARYSVAPFNVLYWEIGNEPDAPIRPDDFVFGCWGVESDPYYGGRAYGEALKVVYPAMKAANPRIQVLNGGLLLDKPYNASRSTETQGRFFEGMLLVGAGNAFDIVSFHSYNYYSANDQPYGPSTDWRIGYLRELLARFNVAEKPMMRTETALLCIDVTTQCRWAQADYVARTFVYAMRDGLMANIWYVYDNDSYHNTALIEPNAVFVPRPAYFAYRHAAKVLSGATYITEHTGLPTGVSVYEFRRGTQTILVYWTDKSDLIPFTLTLPSTQTPRCISRDGGTMSCGVSGLTMNLQAQRSPSFVIWP